MRGLYLFLLLAGLYVQPAPAQPDLSRRIGTTVADSGVPGYRFESIVLQAGDGAQRYRLRVAVPQRAAPPAGYAVAWLLDGNAALMDVQAETLQQLAQSASPPLIVFIAHDNDLRIDGDARAFDYTPCRPGGEAAQRDPLGTRRNGGADAFLALIVEHAMPRVNALARLDPARQALWGHSYGGVFVLHTLFTRPQVFALYGAADPSLWWGEGFLLQEETRAASWPGKPPRLRLWLGEAPPAPARTAAAASDAVAPGVATTAAATTHAATKSAATTGAVTTGAAGNPAAVESMRRARQSVPPDAAQQLAQRLKARGMLVEVETLGGLSHGQTLGASLPRFLAAVAAYTP